jgi:hypothetical protein
MPAWLADFVVTILAKLGSWLVSQGLVYIHGQQVKAATDASIDARLSAFKQAYKEAFNGQPVTPEQRQKLNSSISDFIRGGAPTSGL